MENGTITIIVTMPPPKKIHIYIYPGGKESHGDCFINEMLPPTVQDKHSP